MSEKILPNYKYLTEDEYNNLIDSRAFIGMARVKGYNEPGQEEFDRTIYLIFDSNEKELISQCIKKIVDTFHSYWKSYSKDIIIRDKIDN